MFRYALVNLPTSVDRRLSFLASNQIKIGAPAYSVGVDGRLLCAREYFQLGVHDHEPPMSPAEVGCALSHMQAYEYLEKSGGSALAVFEDDVEATGDFNIDRLLALLEVVRDDEVILLGGLDGLNAKYDLMGYPDTRHFGLWTIPEPMLRWMWRSCCYVIGRRAAKAILDSQRLRLMRADDWRYFHRRCDISFAYISLFQHPSDSTLSLVEAGRSGTQVFSPSARFIRKVGKRLYIDAYKLTLGMRPVHQRP